MNELIKKLSDEAKSKVPNGLDVEDWINVYNEQFARSIVGHISSMMREAMSNEKQADFVYNAMLIDLMVNIDHAFSASAKREIISASFEKAFKDGVDLSGKETP